jgi:hypothetical protein
MWLRDDRRHEPPAAGRWLTNVSALIGREEAAIDDSSEDRRIERFVVVSLADIDAAGVTRHWYADALGLGAKHLRDVTLRRINLGRIGSGAPLA